MVKCTGRAHGIAAAARYSLLVHDERCFFFVFFFLVASFLDFVSRRAVKRPLTLSPLPAIFHAPQVD